MLVTQAYLLRQACLGVLVYNHSTALAAVAMTVTGQAACVKHRGTEQRRAYGVTGNLYEAGLTTPGLSRAGF